MISIEQCQLLLTMGGVSRIIEVKNNGFRGRVERVDEHIKQRLCQPIEVGARQGILKTRKRRLTRKRRSVERLALTGQLPYRVLSELGGIVADDVGTEQDNLELSENRAKKIGLYMIERGIPSDQLYREGRGEVKNNRPKEENRKVELKIFTIE